MSKQEGEHTVLVSVVVPCRNEISHLQRCIQSLLDQEFEADDYEIIFVDNGSTEGSRELLESYPCITLLSDGSPGSYHARNIGLEAARGDILAFTDSDCSVSPQWIRTIREGMNRTKAEVVLGPRFFPLIIIEYPIQGNFL